MAYDYDLMVIGGGSAGLTAAGMGAHLGAKTMMVEADRLGGDCTWTGCVPSKTLLHLSGLARRVKEAGKFGLEISEGIDFGRAMEHVRSRRREVYEEADDPEIFREMGVEVVFGRARFLDDHTVAIEGEGEASSRYIVIATGSRAAVPPIPGLAEVPYHTNETIFEITEQPERLGVIGAGPIGIEMAQAFRRLGSRVTVFERLPRILSADDPELAGMLEERLRAEGVDFRLSADISEVSDGPEGGIRISSDSEGRSAGWEGDDLLVAAGRKANCRELGLEKAGVRYGEEGIAVDDRCRTSRRHIYAAGDVTGRYRFTHMSEHMAKVAVTNALLKIPKKIDAARVPWCTYSDPELAHVGATEERLREKGTSYRAYRFPYGKLDRALTDDATDGLIKVFAKKWSGKILGATVYGRRAGELIGEYALAMRNGATLRNISDTIHPYPTYGLGARRAADQWYVQNRPEWLIRLLGRLFGYRGEVPETDENQIL